MKRKWVLVVFVLILIIFSFGAIPTVVVLAVPEAPEAICGDIVINETKFKQTSAADGGVPEGDEWVELFVVNALSADAIVIVDDLEITTSGRFRLEFTLPSGTPAGKYVIIHDNASGNGESLPSGSAVNAIEFFGAGGSGGSGAGVHLNDSGDNVVLTIDGSACEEVHWGTRGSDANIAPPTPAVNTIAFGSSSSILAGESIQRSPNASGSTFLRAGQGISGSTKVGSPTTLGHNNNTTSNALTLRAMDARTAGGGAALPLLALSLAGGVAAAGARVARRRR